MIGLVIKEVHQQLPFWLFGVALVFIWLGADLLVYAPDARPAGLTLLLVVADDWLHLYAFTVALWAGSGLLGRDFEEGTAIFLLSLPITRDQVFAVRASLHLALVGLLPGTALVWVFVQHALSRSSVDGGLHVQTFLTAALLVLVQCASIASLGLLLGWFGRLGLGIGVALAMLTRIYDSWWVMHYIDPRQLTEPVFHGDVWTPEPGGLLTQVVLCSAMVGASLVMFRRHPVVPRPDVWERLDRVPWRSAAGFGVAALVVLLVWTDAQRDRGGDEKHRPAVPEWSYVTIETDKYAFRTRSDREEALGPLIEGADDVEARVREVFGFSDGLTMEVDVSYSPIHRAGTAFGRKLRLNYGVAARGDGGPALLAHETVHAHLDRESAGGLPFMLHEGIAEWHETVAYDGEFDDDDDDGQDEIARRWQYTALQWYINRVAFEEMLDAEAFSEEHGRSEIYGLGLTFVDTWIDLHGVESVRRVVRQFRVPRNQPADARFYDAFHREGIALDAIVTAWEQRFDKELEALEVPESLDVIIVDDDQGLALVHPSGSKMRCRTRQGEDDWEWTQAEFVDGRCSLDDVSAGTFDYQVGVTAKGMVYPTWSKWKLGLH